MGGKAIPKSETCNIYGDAAAKADLKAFGDHGAFIIVSHKDAPRDEVCIYGMFVYTTNTSH